MLDAFRRVAQLPEQKAASTALLWLSNRLEVLREPPRPRPVSFYFEEAAHAVMLRVFKGTLFDRLLGALDELLGGVGRPGADAEATGPLPGKPHGLLRALPV